MLHTEKKVKITVGKRMKKRLLQGFESSLLPGQNELRDGERLPLRPKDGVLCSSRGKAQFHE